MSSLNVARLTNKLRSLFVLRGGPPPAPEVSDEVVPVVVIEDERPEHFFLAREMLVSFELDAGAVVGEQSWAQLRNPTGSGVLVVIVAIILNNPTGGSMGYAIGPDGTDVAAVTVATGGGVRDRRWIDSAGVANPAAVYETGSSIGFVTATRFAAYSVPGPGTLEYRHPIIVDPGRNVIVQSSLNNTGAFVTFVWYERPLESTEERKQ